MLLLRCATPRLNPFAAPLAVLIFAAVTYAQGGVGSTRGLPDSAAGLHTIEGRVYLPSGRRAGAGITVSLEGNVNGTHRAATDGDGSFLFRSLPAAEYTVVVDGGPDYESVRETVTIFGNTGGTTGPSGQTMMLDIHLRPKGSADAEKMFAQFPKPAVDSYKKGMDAAHNGDSKKAVEFLKQAVAVAPTFDAALRDLGLQYLKLNQMDKAAETFEALLKLKPNDVVANLDLGIALYNLGVALVNQKNLDEAQKKLHGAEAHLREAIKLNSPGPTAHYYLGLTLLKFKAYDEAQKEFELAISNGGENLAQAHRYLGGLYQSAHRNKEAADELEKYLKLDPKAADAERIRGIIKDLRSKQ
jgi:Tfp pilus assembly protein PilF